MKNSSSNKHFVEALETLSSIACLELESPVVIQEVREVSVQKTPLQYRTIHWLHHANKDKIVRVVKSTFRMVLGYLKDFYRKEFGHLGEHDAYESIQNMMALVMQAAKKLDRFSHEILGSHDESVKESEEFRELHAFYQRKVAPLTLQESLLGSMKMLPVKAVIETSKKNLPHPGKSGSHVYIDLETVKNDGEYELFSIRQEDGARFFSPRLLKSIEVVAHLNANLTESQAKDSYALLEKCQDHLARYAAQNLLVAANADIDEHIKEIHLHQNSTFGMLVYQAVQALFLAAHADLHEGAKKNHSDYLFDFQRFIREAIVLYNSVDFDITKGAGRTRHLIDVLMRHFFQGYSLHTEFTHFLTPLSEHQVQEGQDLSQRLQSSYEAVSERANSFDYAPLAKVLHALQVRSLRGFDPYMMQNLPSLLFELKSANNKIPVYRLPTPTYQEYIHKAVCTEEFKSYIASLGKKTHLIFNLQDRTSLREFARTVALENYAATSKCLECVTMTKESDFYHQTGPYSQLNQTSLFIEQLLEHIESESSGYFYPEKIKNALFPDFAKALASAILKLFFQGRNVLPRAMRLDYIELFYLFLQLKIVELVEPHSMSFACKDGLDITLPQASEAYILLHLINGKSISSHELELMENMLFHLPLVIRGRNLFADRFLRMTHLIKQIEAVAEEQGTVEFVKAIHKELRTLFDEKTLNMTVHIS